MHDDATRPDARRRSRRRAARPEAPRAAGPELRWHDPDLDVVAEFRRGMADQEFSLLFQPEVELADRSIVAVEALLRWQHPRFGPLNPDEFIPAAGDAAVLDDLERWVMRAAIRQLAAWSRRLPDSNITLRVNATAQAVERDDLSATVADELSRHEVDAARLCLEVTESAWNGDQQGLVAGVARLKSLGLCIALDDFGAGHSGLSRLRAIPADLIKIDRELIAGLDGDSRAREIVAAVLDLGERLHMDVMAEGVEREAEARALIELGCHAAQGNLISPPVNEPTMSALLRAGVIRAE